MTLETEVQSLRQVPMFRDVDPARLKLLAFTSERVQFSDEVRREFDLQSKEITDLRAENNNRNAAGETCYDREGDIFDERTHFCCAQCDKDYACQQGADNKTSWSMRDDDRREQWHECARWPADLHS